MNKLAMGTASAAIAAVLAVGAPMAASATVTYHTMGYYSSAALCYSVSSQPQYNNAYVKVSTPCTHYIVGLNDWWKFTYAVYS